MNMDECLLQAPFTEARESFGIAQGDGGGGRGEHHSGGGSVGDRLHVTP